MPDDQEKPDNTCPYCLLQVSTGKREKGSFWLTMELETAASQLPELVKNSGKLSYTFDFRGIQYVVEKPVLESFIHKVDTDMVNFVWSIRMDNWLVQATNHEEREE